MKIKSVQIKIWDELVGSVSMDSSRSIAFQYDSNFKKLNWELSPLKLPLVDTPFTFPDLQKNENIELDTFKGLPGLLADSLPDKYGNQLINRWLINEGRPRYSMNPIEVLSFIGNRGMGALEFEPSVLPQNNTDPISIDLEKLVTISRKQIHKPEQFPSYKSDIEELNLLFVISTSAGGARPKAIIAFNEKTAEIKSGASNTPIGFEQWLIKLDGVSDVQLGARVGYGRVEMAYYNMATHCGIEMMPSRLVEENGRAHFMTKRFDREGIDTKHHIQTLCGLAHLDFNNITNYSYEQLFKIMEQLNLNRSDFEQMYRRMIFNVLTRNCDDHTKNISFRLKRNGTWELAPAYDLCHAYRPGSEWVSHHALSINGKRIGISKQDILTAGRMLKIENGFEIIEDTARVVSKWKEYAEEVKVDPKLIVNINESLIEQQNLMNND